MARKNTKWGSDVYQGNNIRAKSRTEEYKFRYVGREDPPRAQHKEF